VRVRGFKTVFMVDNHDFPVAALDSSRFDYSIGRTEYGRVTRGFNINAAVRAGASAASPAECAEGGNNPSVLVFHRPARGNAYGLRRRRRGFNGGFGRRELERFHQHQRAARQRAEINRLRLMNDHAARREKQQTAAK